MIVFNRYKLKQKQYMKDQTPETNPGAMPETPKTTPVQGELGESAVEQTVEIDQAAAASRNIMEGE